MRTIYLFSFLFFPVVLFSHFDQVDLYYYTDIAAQAHKYNDPDYIDRTYFYACHGVGKNYLFSRDVLSRTCERVSRFSIPLFSYSPEHASLPRITIATDVLSLVRLAASLIGSISTDDIRTAALPERIASEYCTWKSADFAKHFRDTVHFELGRSSVDERLLILHQYSLYQFSGFVAFARTFPEFQQELTKIHHRLHHDKKFAIKIARMKEFTNKSFHAIVKQHGAHDKRQGSVRVVAPKEIPLNVPLQQIHNACSIGSSQLKQKYQTLLADDDMQGFQADRIKNRLRALQAGAVDDQQFRLSDSALTLLEGLKRDSAHFSLIHGTAIQQVLQQEFVEIVNQAACMHQELGPNILPVQENLIEFADVGVDYNRAGYVVQSTTVADWCWAWLDCCKRAAFYSVSHGCSPMFMAASIDQKYSWALIEGAAQGTFNVASRCANIVYHPIDSTASFGTELIDVVYYSGYCLAKVMSEACYIDYHRHYGDPLKALDRVNYLVNGGAVLSGCIAQKLQTIPPEQLIKEGAAIAVETWITGKLLTSCLKFISDAGKYAERAQQMIEGVAQVGEGTTTAELLSVEVGHQAEMFLADAAQQGGQSANLFTDLAKKHFSAGALQSKRVEAFIAGCNAAQQEIYCKVPQLAESIVALYQECRYSMLPGFKEIGYRPVRISFKHILGPEIGLIKDGTSFLKGCHHNFKNLLHETGVIKILEKIKSKEIVEGDIFYLAQVEWNGIVSARPKSFFPDTWSPDKVAAKINEAYLYCLNNNISPSISKDGRYIFKGLLAREEIEVKIIIDKLGNMISAYPIFE